MSKRVKQPKKATTSTSSHNLNSLVQELEAVEPSPNWPYATVVGLLAVLIALVWGWYLLAANHRENSRLADQVRQEQPRLFSWTEEDFIALELGMTEEEVLDAYGPAHKREDYPSSQSFVLIYEVQDSVTFKIQQVSLSFSTEDVPSKLVSKFAYDLKNSLVSPLGQGVYARAFNDDDIKELRVGDSETGEGGLSLTEVLTLYGQPTEVVSSLSEQAPSIYSSKSGLERTLFLSYRQPEEAPYDWVSLTFRAKENGDFYLSSKDTD